jgi:hypothetical protein
MEAKKKRHTDPAKLRQEIFPGIMMIEPNLKKGI